MPFSSNSALLRRIFAQRQCRPHLSTRCVLRGLGRTSKRVSQDCTLIRTSALCSPLDADLGMLVTPTCQSYGLAMMAALQIGVLGSILFSGKQSMHPTLARLRCSSHLYAHWLKRSVQQTGSQILALARKVPWLWLWSAPHSRRMM